MITLKKNSAELSTLINEIQRMEQDAMVDEDILVFSRNLVADSGFDANNQLKTVADFTRANIKYQPDPAGTEMFTSPHRMMELIKQGNAFGDCDCIAIFIVAVYRALGYDAHVILIDQSGAGYNHAACEVYSEVLNEKFYVDPTVNFPIAIASSKMRDEPGTQFTPHYVLKLEVK